MSGEKVTWNKSAQQLVHRDASPWDRLKNSESGVVYQLQKHGDNLKSQRLVFYWAYIVDGASRDRFIATVAELG